jgi:hypothetical protein
MPQSARHVIVRAVRLAHGAEFVVQRLAFGRPEQCADYNQQQHPTEGYVPGDARRLALRLRHPALSLER